MYRDSLTKSIEKKSGKSLSIIENIEQIVFLTEDSGLSEESLEKIKPYTDALIGMLNIETTYQAILLSVVVNNYHNEQIEIRNLSRHFGCQNVRLLCLSDDFDYLSAKGYIRRKKLPRTETYRILKRVIDAFMRGEDIAPVSYRVDTFDSFFDLIAKTYWQVHSREMNNEELSHIITEIFTANPDFKIVEKINSYDLKTEDIVLLLLFCFLLVRQNDSSVNQRDISIIYDTETLFGPIKRSLMNGTNILFQRGLLERVAENALSSPDPSFRLTDKAKLELLPEINVLQDFKNTIKAKNIIFKELFYNDREKDQIKQFSSLLSPENFSNIQERLERNGMRKGVASLFYGAPGTGKTETVYQIARQTGRDIMFVNIPEIKSMWVGESEKNIKEVFERYRAFCSKSEIIPILLFNEADAVLGIRKEKAGAAVDKMENSIQNIILQEMETLDGIMIATTNLTKNLDKAFERRFLYKIEFDKPGIDAKRAIWHSLMSELTDVETKELANTYDFSGGQIENIARKRTIESIINGYEPSLDLLHSFCRSELLYKTIVRSKIGYLK